MPTTTRSAIARVGTSSANARSCSAPCPIDALQKAGNLDVPMENSLQHSGNAATRCWPPISQQAVDLASARVEEMRHVTLQQAAHPADWPDGSFDLIVFSEVGYYLEDAVFEKPLHCLLDRSASAVVLSPVTGVTTSRARCAVQSRCMKACTMHWRWKRCARIKTLISFCRRGWPAHRLRNRSACDDCGDHSGA